MIHLAFGQDLESALHSVLSEHRRANQRRNDAPCDEKEGQPHGHAAEDLPLADSPVYSPVSEPGEAAEDPAPMQVS